MLAERLRVPLRELGPRIGLSTSILFAYRNGSQPISEKAWSKLERAEGAERGDAQDYEQALNEPQTPYVTHARPRVIINPAYAMPPPEPTRAQIEARIKAFLDAAEKVPGGLGFAWGQVALHLNPAALGALKIDE